MKTFEQRRVKILEEYGILDSPEDSGFAALTRLVCTLLDVPISIVSILDEKRQWFAAKQGLEIEETPRDISFCAHVVDGQSEIIVPDAREDARFADNPFVCGQTNIRFYAGVPLTNPEGYVLGTLCALDTKPRVISQAQRETLQMLADQAVVQLELRRTSRRLASREAELIAAQRRSDILLNGMSDGVVMQNSDGAIIISNPAAERILGLTNDQIHGRTSFDPHWRSIHLDGTDFSSEHHPSIKAIRTGKSQRDVIMGIHTQEGELRWIHINSEPIVPPSPQGEAVVTTFRDVTKIVSRERTRQSSRAELERRERLTTAGHLASGVAHEINNPLAYITANMEYLREELQRLHLDYLLPVIVDAQEGAKRIHQVIKAMGTFAHEETHVGPTKLKTVIDVAMSLTAHDLRAICTCRVVGLDELTVEVSADESLLAQVLVHLLVNASQAFPSFSPSNAIEIRITQGDDTVCISVTDNGNGIKEEDLPHVFDPFFTTREVGTGTGLGLSVSHGIIESFGGTMQIHSTHNVGTRVDIVLQVSRD